MNIKNKIALWLGIFALALLAANLILENYNKPAKSDTEKPGFAEADSMLSQALSGYRMDIGMFCETVSGEPPVSKVKLPADIFPEIFINDLSALCENSGLRLESEVKKKYFESAINISNGQRDILKISVKRDTLLKRKPAFFSIFISGIEELAPSEINKMLRSPLPLAFILLPDRNNLELYRNIENAGKEWYLNFNAEISDENLKLSAGFSDFRLTKTIAAYIRYFSSDASVVVDTSSQLYKKIKRKLIRNGLGIIPINKITELKPLSDNNILSLLRFYISSSIEGREYFFLLSPENFYLVESDLLRIEKKGYKLIYPGKSSTFNNL